MDIIEPGNYEDAVTRLRKDPVVIAMAREMRNAPLDELDLTAPDGGLSTAYMSLANEEYTRRGGKFEGPKPIGAVGRAIMSLLAVPVTGEELYDGLPDETLQKWAGRVASRLATASPDLVEPLQRAHAELVEELDRRRRA